MYARHVPIGITEGPICAHRLHHTSLYCRTSADFTLMECSETVFFSTVDIKCSGPVVW